MSDTDSKVLSADPTVTTCLAAYINAAMEADVLARIEYLLTYGRTWAPLGNGASINDGASTTAHTAL